MELFSAGDLIVREGDDWIRGGRDHVREYKYLSWVDVVDRKIRHEDH